jgi:DNA invertase Pin-like site-specific DNA recombinase
MRCRKDIATVVPRPRRLLKTRSRICSVSISKDFVHAGRVSSGDRPPAHLTRHLLFAVIAYRIQADRFGDLDRATRQVLDQTVAKKDGAAMSARLASFDQKRTELTPGTVLVREWDRQSHRVMMMADGFAWKSQAHAGWTLIRSRYDDGGYSGGSTDRPDLQKLLDDIRARKIDVIVVYKVDRLTRSLADFAKLVELFDSHGVSFVSVTQQFNTTTSMGRPTDPQRSLVLAQFEREVTSERIRDKIAASKRKGLWVGGNLPLGYEMKDGKIAIVEEAELVRSIFRRYLELGSVNELLRDLRERNIRTKSRLLSTGATRGGIPFSRGALYYLLSNHFYVGEVKYKNEILPGEQPPILDRELFAAVRQESLAQWSHRTVARNKSDHLLTGLLFDDAGHRGSQLTLQKLACAIATTYRRLFCMERQRPRQPDRSPAFPQLTYEPDRGACMKSVGTWGCESKGLGAFSKFVSPVCPRMPYGPSLRRSNLI